MALLPYRSSFEMAGLPIAIGLECSDKTQLARPKQLWAPTFADFLVIHNGLKVYICTWPWYTKLPHSK